MPLPQQSVHLLPQSLSLNACLWAMMQIVCIMYMCAAQDKAMQYPNRKIASPCAAEAEQLQNEDVAPEYAHNARGAYYNQPELNSSTAQHRKTSP